MFGIGKAIDWRTSRAHLLLLARFMIDADSAALPDYWTQVLGETPAQAIKRLAEAGCIGPSLLEAKVDLKFKASDLKALLKSRGLKCSGRKADLAVRLIEHDRPSLEQATREIVAFQCTALGRQAAEKFKADAEAEKTQAEREVLDLLMKRELLGAALRMGRHEALQVFPRGMGIDWGRYNPDYDVIVLKAIFDETPQLLIKIEPPVLDALRLGAGMMHLWAENSATRWFGEMPVTGIHLDPATSSRMLVFFGWLRREIYQLREAGVRKVEILGGGEGSCPGCRSLAGKRFPLSKTPELPFPSCTCSGGCPCTTATADGW